MIKLYSLLLEVAHSTCGIIGRLGLWLSVDKITMITLIFKVAVLETAIAVFNFHVTINEITDT